jgi:hypothetical protein
MRREGHFDKHRLVQIICAGSAPKPTHHCARFIHDAMRGAGMKLPSLDAWQYGRDKGSILKAAGFEQVPPVGYHPQVGDIVVWLPCLGSPVEGYPKGAKHVYGHIQVSTGRSDYRGFRISNSMTIPPSPAQWGLAE